MQQNEASKAFASTSNKASADLTQICSQLHSSDRKLEGLKALDVALQQSGAQGQNLICLEQNRGQLERVFQGIQACLQVNEDEEETLMQTNQILYDMMPDILKYPQDLQPQISGLIPFLVENLGNPKGTVRKQTHKVIGTFVKLSKKLEPVLASLIKHGIAKKDSQRTRQHSMLVVPALISLKPQVIEQRPPPIEMQLLVEEVIARLKDPQEIVAKTARKLIAEMHKCYPQQFVPIFIDTLQNQEERQICNLLISNQTDEAIKLIQLSISNQLLVSSKPQNVSSPLNTSILSNATTATVQNVQQSKKIDMAAYGKSLQPQSQINSLSTIQNPTVQTLNSQSSINSQKQGNLIAQGPLRPQQPQSQQNQQLRELSIVGHEIISSTTIGNQLQQKQNTFRQQDSNTQSQAEPVQRQTSQPSILNPAARKLNEPLVISALAIQPLTQKVEIQVEPELSRLAFGMIDANIIRSLNENNPWQERTQAIEQLESHVSQLIGQFTQDQANDLLTFLITLIQDINFKISLASLKIITTLFRRHQITSQKNFASLVGTLVDKLSDSKSVVRDAILECCALLIDQYTPLSFMNLIYKSFHNTNWRVREGLQILFARCLIETSEANIDSKELLNEKTVEELTFSLKCEDKAKLQQMAIDNFAFSVFLTRDRNQLLTKIQKGIGAKSGLTERENDIMDQILFRNEIQAFAAIGMTSGRIQFQPWTTREEYNSPAPQHQGEIEMPPSFSNIQQPPAASNLKIAVPLPEFNNSFLEQSLPSNTILTSPKDRDSRSLVGSMIQLEGGVPQSHHHLSRTADNMNQALKTNQPMIRTSVSNQMLQSQNQFIQPSTNLQQQTSNQYDVHSTGAFSQIFRPTQQHSNQQIPPQTQEAPIWLPTFSQQQPSQTQYQADDMQRKNSRKSDSSSNPFSHLSVQQNEQTVPNFQPHHSSGTKSHISSTSNRTQTHPLNNTSDAQQAKFGVDDQHSVLTSTTFVSSTNKPENMSRLPVQKQISEGNRSLVFSDVKKQGLDGQDNFRNQFGQSQQLVPAPNQTNYIPEQHKSQPRSIQSNQDKQRLLANSTNSTGSNFDLQHLSAQTSTTQVNSFDKNQVNDRLTLLKSNFKQKSAGSSFVESTPQSLSGVSGVSGINTYHQYSAAADGRGSMQDDQISDQGASSVYGQRRTGPVRATHIKIPEEQKYLKKTISQQPVQQTHAQFQTRQAVSAVKPPINTQNARSQAVSDTQSELKYDVSHERNSSIEYQNPKGSDFNFNHSTPIQGSQSSTKKSYPKPAPSSTHQSHNVSHQDEFQLNATENVGADYTLKDEPLHNPQQALTAAIQDLKSSDWSTQFEACNVIRRASIYHVDIIGRNLQVFKELVKPVDSLRSQVSKNASLAMQSLFANVSVREADQQIETVLPVLLKRSADTNQFISESAEECLAQIIKNCTETRIFTCLTTQALKNNKQKELILHAYALLVERLSSSGRIRSFTSLERLVQIIVGMLSESAAEVRNQAKVCIFKLQSGVGSQRDLLGVMSKCHLNDRQMEQVVKLLKSEDLESLSQYGNTRYGQMRASPAPPQGNSQGKSAVGVTDGSTRRSAGQNGGNQMVQTFLSGKESIGPPTSVGSFNSSQMPPNESIYSANPQSQVGYGSGSMENTQTTFKKRQSSVSKPVDRDLMDQFKGIVDSCGQTDWQKRVKAIDELQGWIERNSKKVKTSQPGSFISLVDIYCQLVQDNNGKVQGRAQTSLESVMGNRDIGGLLNSNLTMIVQALTQNVSSTSQNVRAHGEHLFSMLEEVVMAENNGTTNPLIQPVTNQIGLNQCRAKAQLVTRLSQMVGRVDKVALVERYVTPLLQPSNKIQQEANGNQQLKHALAALEAQVQR